MLAKVWKKVLLAVCIIACIYNIMSKLVNRASLEDNLQRANDGNTIFDFSSKESKADNSEIVDGIVSKNTVVQNSVENIIVEDEIIEETQNTEEQPEEEQPENDEKKSESVKFTDFIFKW